MEIWRRYPSLDCINVQYAPKKVLSSLEEIFFCAGINALKVKAHWKCSLELLPLCLSFHMPPNISDRSSFSMESTSERSLTSWPSTLSGWANICGSLKATELFSRKSEDDGADFKRFLAFCCLYLFRLCVFCHVCLFWSVAHLGGERGGSHRAICYFEGRLRKDLNL